MADSRDSLTTLRQGLAFLAAPAVLLAVAATQIYHVQRHGLCPWRGGGFGMFSTIDVPELRMLRAYLVVDGEEVPMTVPEDLAKLNAAARILPTPKNLTRLGSALLHIVRSSAGERPEGAKKAQMSVRVEVWRATFDISTQELKPMKLRELRIVGRS